MNSSKFAQADLNTQTPFGGCRFPAIARIAWAAVTWRKLPRKLRKRIRKRFARRFPGPFDRNVEGIGFRLYPAENHSDRVMAGRGELPEIPERKLIGGLIFPGMTFVDIGANIGVYSLHIAHLTDGNANIVAFEPHPRTFAKLRYNCEANRFDNIACINSGVGPSEGETILFSDGGGNIGGASMLREASGDAVSDTVRTTRLDAQLRSRGVSSVDLLKIDIEGFEDRALMPFFSMTGNSGLFPNAILLETVHRRLWQDDILNHLAGLGYRVIAQTEENVLLKRQIAA